MRLPTLRQLYSDHENKTSDKWSLYLDAYDDIFCNYRDRRVRLLEIGIQNGGSLEIWSKYFFNSKLLVGCDINESCRSLKYDDERIHVVIGDANNDAIQKNILACSEQYDIILDDGSHQSRDIVSSFARYFPCLTDDGLYVVEDLHCSYWEAFGGGLFDPHSSMSFFKRLADVINFEHWGVGGSRTDALTAFSQIYGCSFDAANLEGIYSVEFRNSMCLIRKKPAIQTILGPRVVAGKIDLISAQERPLNGLTIAEVMAVDESRNQWSDLRLLPEVELAQLRTEAKTLRESMQAAEENLRRQIVEMAGLKEQHTRETSDQARDRRQLELANSKQRREFVALRARFDQIADELRAAKEARTAITASRTWRIALKLRLVAEKFPRLSRFGWRSAKTVKLLVTMQFAQIYREIKLRHQAKGIAAELAESRLFDADYYRAQYPDVAPLGNPLLHYVMRGGVEGRNPHPLFDGRWYLSRYPFLVAKGINPLTHYLKNPNSSPNPFFDGQWYLERYPDVEASNINPLLHYFEFGASEGRDPSPKFATKWYLERNPDVAQSGANPLAHFLSHGLAEGRSPSVAAFAARQGISVLRSEIHCVMPPKLGKENALFVAHSPDGSLKPHVTHYLESLKKSDIAVTLIVAADAPFEALPNLTSIVSGLFVRRNEGYDFAAWAHVLRLRPDLLDSDILYLLNDSLIGPFNQADFDLMLSRVRRSAADLVGATENHERTGWHLQSFFLALKKKALASVVFQSFINDVTVLQDKDDIINQFELQFAPKLRVAGLSCEALFPAEGLSNPTIYKWRKLIDDGFPFVKVMVLRDTFEGVDVSGWPEVLRTRGFDPAIAVQTLKEARRKFQTERSKAPLSTAPSTPVVQSRTSLRVSLIAPWNFDNGLGVASRSYISALRHSGFLLNLHPIKHPFHVHRQITPPIDICDFNEDTDVALIQLNPDGWESLLTESQLNVIRKARVRIGLWVWETPTVPAGWLKVMSQVDAIWAPTQYCADAFSAAIGVPVHVVPYVVPARQSSMLDAQPKSVRQALGNVATEKIILYAFDGSSYLVRKNPFALVRAFGKARLYEEGWSLVLKTKHVFDSQLQGNLLADLVDRTPGTIMLNRSLDKEAMNALMSAASIYASPHCAEGFGLTVAEAMAMGKLVISTDYSGTRDFVDSTCGFPVEYQMRALKDDQGVYNSGSTWAAIDEDKLAEALLSAARMIDIGDKTKSDAARTRIRNRLSPQSVAGYMEASLRQLLPGEISASAIAKVVQS
ncbi:Demethylmacrocin O-methyltransferase [Variovorax sp. PBS-H4]|uniref:rhamnan synthesis F family protein n=1 Tax=Variovorax sp. PBS-H4 TaxID=434008 RepID=UPI001316CF14|nr:rhamnan synthesis F family protein [Variovorax sp. PBS-H4]VTU21374.1 Demethylmacrocin O-methyltransferase [Variovorax sp. PBS-H4]